MGSIATGLEFRGIFSDRFIANTLLSVPLKEFRKIEKHSESVETSVKAAYCPYMALFLVSLPSYPENFIKIR